MYILITFACIYCAYRINKTYNYLAVKFFTGALFSEIIALFLMASFPIVRPYTNEETLYSTLESFKLHAYIGNRISLDMQLFLISIFSTLFIVFILGYAIESTSNYKIMRFHVSYRPLFLYPLATSLTGNPYVYKWLYNINQVQKHWSTLEINLLFDFINDSLKIIGFCMAFVVISKLFNHYINQPKVRVWKQSALYNFLLIIPFAVIYLLILNWIPSRVIDISGSGYFQYILDPIENKITYSVLILYFLPLIIVYETAVLMHLKRIYDEYDNLNTAINQRIDTASMSIKVFNHSVKNHLMSITYEADYLKNKYKRDEETIYSLDLISQSCSHSIDILKLTTNQLKDFFISPKAISVDIPILNALSRIRNHSQNVKLYHYLPSNIPFSFIDEWHMSEALYNLLINAIEAVGDKDNGEIRITLKEHKAWAILSVSDNGCGIASEDLSEIFTPFVSTKASTNNWGLGLSYCYKVIHAHKGKIVAESKLNQGTTFKIMIPTI